MASSAHAFKLLSFVCLLHLVRARFCSNVVVRNTVDDLKQALTGCTIVTHQLHIALIQNEPERFIGVSFPELREIWGYLIIFNVYGLTNLGALFPRLERVRGTLTFRGFVIVLYGLPDLRSIGLTSLRKIERGKVRISDSPNLCYYDTIDWGLLGTELKSPNQSSVGCPPCPAICNGKCWSDTECQTNETMETCPQFVNEEHCVDHCPDNKIILEPGNECITLEQCKLIDVKRNWFPYNNTCIPDCPVHYLRQNETCIYCGDNCRVICIPPQVISTLQSVKELRGCTHINGSLHININDEEVAKELAKLDYMRDIIEIWGSLKVTRSPSLQSLEFLNNLQLIRGDLLHKRNFSLVVLENQNLHKLWVYNATFKLHIQRGELLFHYNPQLCYSEIEKLNNLTLQRDLPPLQVSKESNGDQRLCQEFALNTNGSTIHSTNITLRWQYNLSNRNLRGFLVYYIETDDIPVETAETCLMNSWNVQFTINNTVFISDLQPFTNYSFYIVVSSLKGSSQQKTKIFNITTLSDDPSSPRDIRVLSFNSSALLLSWLPPAETNGILEKYVITYSKLIDDNTIIRTRDYCRHPNSGTFIDGLINEQSVLDEEATPAMEKCACDPFSANRAARSIDQRSKTQWYDDQDFHNFIGLTNNSSSDKMMYHYDWSFNNGINNLSAPQTSDYMEKVVPANETSTLITGLDHFSTYVFYMSACNINRTAVQQCSEVISVYNRTKRLQSADNLRDYHLRETESGVSLNWSNPPTPNSLITSYTVEWKTDASSNHICIAPSQITANGFLLRLAAGDYRIRVRANTFAGPGDFTTFQNYFTGTETDYVLIAVLACVFVFAAALLSGVGLYFRHKRQHEHEHLQLIASINPEYCPTYIADEWEIDREEIDIGSSLGKGVFGVVYKGRLKARNLMCAVKTVNINATISEKQDFLNEASVMKAFSNAHHVVKLIGVVSRGVAPLVVMELMERGDMKNYLRQSRESSQSIGCNEMYRMAIEIADGMAYLAAKKFVHRDLAARNCMVAADRTIKVGDFGMARDIYETDYYRKDTYGLLPVRWMAPESLADGVFTTDSDAWSYGVVLWEMVTLAEQPYQGLASAQVLQFVVARGRLERPPECPDLLYDIMDVCWRWQPNRRPQFVDIVAKLQQHVHEDFVAISFYHSREGNEYRLHAKERPYNPPALAQTQRRDKTDAVAYFHGSGEDIRLYNEPRRKQSLLLDYAYEDDEEHEAAASCSVGGYRSLSKQTM